MKLAQKTIRQCFNRSEKPSALIAEADEEDDDDDDEGMRLNDHCGRRWLIQNTSIPKWTYHEWRRGRMMILVVSRCDCLRAWRSTFDERAHQSSAFIRLSSADSCSPRKCCLAQCNHSFAKPMESQSIRRSISDWSTVEFLPGLPNYEWWTKSRLRSSSKRSL